MTKQPTTIKRTSPKFAYVGENRYFCAEIMESQRTHFTPAQLHVLEMMKYFKSESAVKELQQVLADYYAGKVQQEADRLWDDGRLNAEEIEDIGKTHLRTPYIHS